MLILGSAPAVYATGDANDPGSDSCGLGWQVTRKKSFIATTTRGTTNYVVPYTFGMTTGTMGCDQHSFAKKDRQAIEYVASNYEPLTIEMAAGRGEYLQAFAQVMGCGSSTGQFGTVMQKNYGDIVGKSKNAIDFFQNVKTSVKKEGRLAANCGLI